jgi:hypothetical protein
VILILAADLLAVLFNPRLRHGLAAQKSPS